VNGPAGVDEVERVGQAPRVASPSTQHTWTPPRASRRAFSRPAAERSTPVTSQPSVAKKTLSRPSPQPSSRTCAPARSKALTRPAKADRCAPRRTRWAGERTRVPTGSLSWLEPPDVARGGGAPPLVGPDRMAAGMVGPAGPHVEGPAMPWAVDDRAAELRGPPR
jgi:hypothetical protein